MAINWEKLDKQYDFDGIEDAIAEAENNSDFPEIPDGDYEVHVTKMELGESKKKDPMLRITFEILEGEYKGFKLFYNGVIQMWQPARTFGFQISKNNDMLRNLWDADDEEVKFKNFSQYNELIEDIADEIIEDDWNYVLNKEKDGDFDQFEITEILD